MSTDSRTAALLFARVGIAARRTLERRLVPWRITATEYALLCSLQWHGGSHLRALDGRLVILHLSATGEALLADLAPVIARLDHQLVLAVPAPFRHGVMEGLRRLAATHVLGPKEMQWSD